MSFRSEAVNPRTLPGWILGPLGQYYVRVLGIAQDRLLQSIYEKRRANMPSFAPSQAIRSEIARDRAVQLFPGESVASQIARLLRWRSSARTRGTGAGILREGQPLWLPEAPTVRLVAGNSTRATWYTVYGDDAALAVDQARWDLLVSPAFPRPVAGSFSYVRQEPSNWDWYSGYFAATAYTEPVKLFRFWQIVYAPPSVVFYGSEGPGENPDAGATVGSSLTQTFASSLAGAANFGKKPGAKLWGVILASDPESFDPMGDNTTVPGGYPDGSWWNAASYMGYTRLSSASYYSDREPYVL